MLHKMKHELDKKVTRKNKCTDWVNEILKTLED
jgi:hypothetical protein